MGRRHLSLEGVGVRKLLSRLVLGSWPLTGRRVPANLAVLIISDCVAELKTENIILVKPIALKSVNDQGGLEFVFEVGEAEDYFFAWSLLAGNEPHRFEAGEGPENMGDFTFGGPTRDAFHVHSVCCVLGNGHDLGLEKI